MTTQVEHRPVHPRTQQRTLPRLGIIHGTLPGWIFAKLVIWGALAVSVALLYRGVRAARALLVLTPLLALAAAAIALYKPF